MAEMKKMLQEFVDECNHNSTLPKTVQVELDYVIKRLQNILTDSVLEPSTYVVEADGDGFIPDGQYLITVGGDKARLAFRERRGDTWSPPLWASQN